MTDLLPPNEEDILAEIVALIESLESHPDPDVRERVTMLLSRVDAVHRSALTHLMGAIQSMAGEAFITRLAADPTIRLLLMSYDLLAVDRRTLAEEALDAVRGHLRAHGVEVELLEVVGGVVSVRLHGLESNAAPPDAARRDIEKALRAGLLGFQELEVRGADEPDRAPATGFVPATALSRARKPLRFATLLVDELAPSSMRAVTVQDVSILLVNVAGELFAVRNACGESPLPLEFGSIEGSEIRCSWHGCRYDLRTGRRLDRDAPREEWLTVLPVAVRDGIIEVALGTTSAREPAA
jgi:nitrite reductase/ring-hydroxylating ferredoxin subunit